MHVDENTPGDRASNCKSLMKPVNLDIPKKKTQTIIHECLTCGKKMRNIVAPDDDVDAVIALSERA